MERDKLVEVLTCVYDLRPSTAFKVADAIDDIVMAIKNEAYIVGIQKNEL